MSQTRVAYHIRCLLTYYNKQYFQGIDSVYQVCLKWELDILIHVKKFTFYLFFPDCEVFIILKSIPINYTGQKFLFDRYILKYTQTILNCCKLIIL